MADDSMTGDPKMDKVVADYIVMDDDIKKGRKQLKVVRDNFVRCRKIVIDHMVKRKNGPWIPINGGAQILECVQKTLKRRPTSEQMLEKMRELIASGVKDPVAMIEELQNCGGTYTEYRLSRRGRRVNAMSVLADANAMVASAMSQMKRGGTGGKKKSSRPASEAGTPRQ